MANATYESALAALEKPIGVDAHHKYYKILRAGMCHQGYKYQIDISSCCPGGMYFCKLKDIPRWLDLYEDNETIAEVHFLPHSQVETLPGGRMRVDWFVLRNPKPIHKFIRRYWEPRDLIFRSPFLIRYMEQPGQILQFLAVNENPHSVGCIDQLTHETAMDAVKLNGLCIRHLKYQCIEKLTAAVKQNGMALAWANPAFYTYNFYEKEYAKICMIAVKQNGLALRFVKHQTTELCLAAVRQNGYAIIYVWPALKTMDICREAWYQNKRVLDLTTPEFQRIIAQRKFVLH